MTTKKEAKLRILEEANFRELYHRYQYIDCPDEIPTLKESLNMPKDATGLLTYCYIEEGLGLSFYILCGAAYREGAIVLGENLVNDLARVRYGDVWAQKFLDQDDLDVDFSPYESIRKYTAEQFETDNQLRQMIYDLELIDGSRNVECPEYVSVIVQKEGLYPEYVWVRCTGFGKTEIHGELLEPPKQDYGLHKADPITFQMVEAEGKIYLIWMPEE